MICYILLFLAPTVVAIFPVSNLKNSSRIELLPHFAVSSEVGSRCHQQTSRLIKDLEEMEVWAVKMVDSSGKLPSGILNGNVHALGDFWQCLDISEFLSGSHDEGGGKLIGKYCLIEAYVEFADTNAIDPKVTEILDLILSHRAIQSTYADGVKFFPSFSPMTWGLCIPESCSYIDVLKTVHTLLEPYNNTNGLVVRLKADEDSCDIPRESHFHEGVALPVMILLWTIFGLSIMGSAIEFFSPISNNTYFQNNTIFELIGAFSLIKNWNTLIRMEPTQDDISCVHGIRFIFSITIYLLHRGVFGMFVPFSNRTAIARILEGEWTMVFRAFWNNVDSFVVLSGLLTSYYSIKNLQKGQKLNVLLMYVRRYYKFTPMYIITVLIIRNLAMEMRTGPNAVRVAKHFVLTCQNNFWKTFLYIANWDGMNDMCYPPAHQLVTDMQMYLLSPGIVLLLWRFGRKGMITVLFTICGLTIYKGFVIYTYKMGSFIYFGASLSEMLTSANQMYLNPIHRLTPYLFGVLLGYFMRTHGHHIKFTQEGINLGWCAAILAGYYSFFGPKHVANRSYVLNVQESAIFGMMQPVLWSSALCWVIFVCHSGKGGTVNQILSWRGFIIFTKLSYAFYLTQILVIFWGIAGANSPEYMRMHQIIDFNEIFFVMLMSVVFTLLFLLPLGEIHTLLSEKVSKTHQQSQAGFSKAASTNLDELGSFQGFSMTVS